eukprot:6467163-Pyramimonas_sp.AAC.1
MGEGLYCAELVRAGAEHIAERRREPPRSHGGRLEGSEQRGLSRRRGSEEAQGAPEATRQHADVAGWHRDLRGQVRVPQVGGDDCDQLLQRQPEFFSGRAGRALGQPGDALARLSRSAGRGMQDGHRGALALSPQWE